MRIAAVVVLSSLLVSCGPRPIGPHGYAVVGTSEHKVQSCSRETFDGKPALQLVLDKETVVVSMEGKAYVSARNWAGATILYQCESQARAAWAAEQGELVVDCRLHEGYLRVTATYDCRAR